MLEIQNAQRYEKPAKKYDRVFYIKNIQKVYYLQRFVCGHRRPLRDREQHVLWPQKMLYGQRARKTCSMYTEHVLWP